ncbi:MAG: heavy-metal-associated domain-containing protein [Bacillota bacterium]
MKKIIDVDGMSCNHCVLALEKALNNIEAVKAKVNLKKEQAIIKAPNGIEDKIIEETVSNAGYKVKSIK